MNKPRSLDIAKRIGTGLCFIVFSLTFVFAFGMHPGLLAPRLLSPAEMIQRAHRAGLLQFAHVLVTLNTAVLVVLALHFMRLLDRTRAGWAGFVGACLAVLGAVLLAADKGALCLSMSALDSLPEDQFASMIPGLVAMFSFKGWMVVVWGFLLLPIGFAIQAVGLLRTRALPRWQVVLFLVGTLLVGFPDGAEIVNLAASVLMSVALVPYGLRLVAGPVPPAATPA